MMTPLADQNQLRGSATKQTSRESENENTYQIDFIHENQLTNEDEIGKIPEKQLGNAEINLEEQPLDHKPIGA